jgi:crotonobetainyl-CoA:carnitine CoA-transferase CaiB-like acyl-CoA transferase
MSQDAVPLAQVRVVDLATGAVGAIGRLLGELGADVIRVEPPGGAVDRREGRRVEGVSLDFVANNLGKRAMVLDLHVAADRGTFDALLATTDILIDSSAPDSAESALLDLPALASAHPALVILSVTAFGRASSVAHWNVTDPVIHALTGSLARSGLPGREPLIPPGRLAYSCAVPQAAFVALVAYMNRLRTGVGDLLDFSLVDGAALALDPGYGTGGSATLGKSASQLPRGRPNAGHMYPIVDCADGKVRVVILSPRQWQGMFDWMGRPEAFSDPSYWKTAHRFESTTLIPAIAAFFADKTRAEIEAEGQRRGVPLAALLDIDEALASAQVQARGSFIDIEVAPGLRAPAPNGVLEIDGVRAGVRGPAPSIGQHQQAVLAQIVGHERSATPQVNGPDSRRALEGLRVLDLGVIVVGAETGRLLADQGADVIKVEASSFPDGARQSANAQGMSLTVAGGHRNKRSLGLNLRDPAGKELFLRLVADSDVVLTNFKPGTMQSLGLGDDVLAAANPRLIMVDSSAFGATGPWSRRLGYGPLVRASSGLTAQWRYPDDPGGFSDGTTVYPDHVAARIGAMGILALLIRRLRTGRGGTVSVAQSEVMLSHMAEQIAAKFLKQRDSKIENGESDAPWGVFPTAGDDEWCVVTVSSDAQWRSLAAVIQRPDLAADASLSSRTGRDAQRAAIDAALKQWLADRTSRDAMHLLQEAGVPAAAMLRVSEMPGLPHYLERRLFREVRDPRLPEPMLQETAPVISQRLPDPPNRLAPVPGQHSAQIAQERFNLTAEQIDALVERKVLETPRAFGVG